MRSPEITQKLHEMKFEVVASTPEQFTGRVKSEIPRWRQVIKATGTQAE